MQTASLKLLTNSSADSAVMQWPGGRGWFSAKGTWGGGNATLKFLLPDGITYAQACAPLTADGGVAFELPPCSVFVDVTTATAVYARADRIPN